jgi:hypothetical protein
MGGFFLQVFLTETLSGATSHFGATNAGCILDERLPSSNLSSLSCGHPGCHVRAFQSTKPVEENVLYKH